MSGYLERPPADHSLIGRMIRASRLETDLYAEVEADKTATPQAAAVVFLASLAGGAGAGAPFWEFALGALLGLGSWYLIAYVVYWVGARVLPEPSTDTNFGALLRALGFANTPGILRLLGVLTPIRDLVFFAAGMWSLVAMITAVRHALSYTSSWRALGVCIIPLLGSLLFQLAAIAVFSQGEVVP
ncbi:MAG: YIP1 family protein, partial [Myxococcota bacterium]